MSTNYNKMKIEAGGWVVVCDGRKALILVNQGDEAFPNLRTHEVHEQENPPAGVQGTDAPGRVHQSASTARSAVEVTDWHDEAEREFLRKLAGRLDQAVAAGEATSLVIVAAPRALGMLRPFYGRPLAAAIVAEVDRDMVKLPVYEIEKHLAA